MFTAMSNEEMNSITGAWKLFGTEATWYGNDCMIQKDVLNSDTGKLENVCTTKVVEKSYFLGICYNTDKYYSELGPEKDTCNSSTPTS